MPKKPRKTRVGSKAWSAQVARDKARHQTQQQEPKPKARSTWKDDSWYKRQQEQRQEDYQQQQQEHQKRQQSAQRQVPEISMRLKCLRALGLTSVATDADIKKAYKHMSLLYHPDRNSLPSALEKMKGINNAFEYLTGKNKD